MEWTKQNVTTYRRDDGCVVNYERVDDIWVIRPRSGQIIALCPCCDRNMLNSRSAMLVADSFVEDIRSN